MSKTSLACCWGVVLAAGAVACGAPYSEVTETDTEALGTQPDLLWYNHKTGELSAWLLSGTTVTGTKSLDATCGSGCSSNWWPESTDGNGLWWHNHLSGEVTSWSWDKNGHVSFGPNLSWGCSWYSGCTDAWGMIGVLNLKPKSCSGICIPVKGMLWWNAQSGELSVWLVGSDGVTVTGAVSLSKKCGSANNCTFHPAAVTSTADYDGDGNTDILWRDDAAGKLTVWLIKDTSGVIKSTQTLSWTVASGSGWAPIAGADVNGDGHVDLLWLSSSGPLSSWLLDGRGNVTGTQTLSWGCDYACTNAGWWPQGYVTFAATSPPVR